MLRFFRYLLRLVRVTVVTVACLALALLVMLSLTQLPLPAWALDRITGYFTTPSSILKIENASIGFKQGLALGGIQMRMNLSTNDLYLKADMLYLDLVARPGKPWSEWIGGLRVTGGYGSLEPACLPPATSAVRQNFLRDLTLRQVAVVLKEPSFAGIAPRLVTAEVSLDDQTLHFDNCRIAWRANENEYVTGYVVFNAATLDLRIKAEGNVSQQHVRPLLVLINSRVVLQYCDKITSLKVPLKVDCDINMTPHDERYIFNIRGRNIAWRGDPLEQVVCTIHAEHTVGADDWHVTLDPLRVTAPAGDADAVLEYSESSGELYVRAESQMLATNLFEIIEVLHSGELARVLIKGQPKLTIKGIIDADSQRDIPYDLSGTIATPDVNLYGLPLVNASCDLRITNQWLVAFDNVAANFQNGGQLTGSFHMDLTDGLHSIPFEAAGRFSDATLHDMFLPFNRTNNWAGRMAGEAWMSGNLLTNMVASLNGRGHVALNGGIIARMPLFAGFTDFLARNVPGVDMLVNQSDAKVVYRIKNGVIHIDDFLLEGSFFSIAGKGTYSIEEDMINATARVNIFRRGSYAGYISRLITLPFDRLLLEFRVTGSVDNPDWNYRGIISRIVEGVTGSTSATPPPAADKKK